MLKDYHLILGVNAAATADDLKSAYRRKAMELHPDTSGRDSEAFLELQEAYGVLTHSRPPLDEREIPVIRRSRRGSSYRRNRGEPLRSIEPAAGFDEVSVTDSFETYQPSFDEIFERWWGNFVGADRPKGEHLESLTLDVPLSVSDAARGGQVVARIPVRAVCTGCAGQGAVGPYECWRCAGQGALAVECPVRIPYPAGLRTDHVVRIPLDRFGIANFYLTLRFRVTDELAWPH